MLDHASFDEIREGQAMIPDITTLEHWVDTILTQLTEDTSVTFDITEVHSPCGDFNADPESVAVRLRINTDSAGSIFLGTDQTSEEALARLASELQDHIIDHEWGRPLPPCPGHQHPLSTGVSDGTAYWKCPHDEDHFRREILSL
ncbi:hypothetical protein EBO15_19630 [Actinomadura harenae]|uniref:Uncharacterized protein n=2 Tax=Actinomadura harenae TaxID=2483351 RepID=A0A3M2M0P7_9ACTN|nr:hypothetical protein EBO15_19630 [Actinomadura harenae]